MAVVEHDFNNGLTVKNQTRFADYKRFYQNVYPGSAVSGARHLYAGGLQQQNDRQNIVNQTDWTYKFNTDVWKHTLVFGTEFAQPAVRQRAVHRLLQQRHGHLNVRSRRPTRHRSRTSPSPAWPPMPGTGPI